jgi:hypothetical protein
MIKQVYAAAERFERSPKTVNTMAASPPKGRARMPTPLNLIDHQA